MANAYYSEGTERSSRVRALFDRIARRYDLINDVQSLGLHRLWKRAVIRQVAAVNPRRVLDVCCGTGDLTLAFRQRGIDSTGIDFSGAMLAQARARALAPEPSGRSSTACFAQADALQLPFADGTFDAVTISYGLRNLADIDRGLGELLRVLRPGGLLVVLDFGKPAASWWRWCYFNYLAVAVPVFGWLFVGDATAYAYILESLKHYPAQRGIEQRLNNLGCDAVEVEEFLGGAMAINTAQKPGTRKQEGH